jgi:23S rRNA pseudouridine1911/1915/1917 synthase
MRDARTEWRVCERFPVSQRAALNVYPKTGRTHQIRVHLASVGLPIVGDPTYGHKRGSLELGRPALHAAALTFTHPRSGERMNFDAPLPSDLAGLLASLGRREGTDR